MDPTISFILQAILGALMLFFGIILNGLRTDMKADRETTIESLKEVRDDLKQLNDAVLGKYALTEDIASWRASHLLEEAKWKETHMLNLADQIKDQRTLDHTVRDLLQDYAIRLTKLEGKPYSEK